MQRTWFTADAHFGHANVISYCGRPFASVEEMDEAMVARWNACVADEDVVYVLGDFAKEAEHGFRILARLRGVKVLVPGNHDGCHPSSDCADAARERYLEAGWSAISESLTLELEGRTVLLHHYPYQGHRPFPDRDLGEDRFAPHDEGLWLLHGHAHEVWKVRGRMINVGVDGWGFAPVSVEELLTLMED